LAVQQRFLQGSEPSLTPAPHFGLGATCYATVTSPIRRYQDLYNQRLIHQLLDKKKIVTLKHKHLEKLIETINNNRSASRLMEQWLIADYMQDKIGQTFTGTIGLLTNQGIGIRLCDTGIEGFIAGKREDKENPDVAYDKISFNNQRMELSWNGHDLHLDQEVEVTLIGVDMDKKKLILEWATPL
jgi:exoribonuclease-2/ribonuclease R